MRTFPTKAMLIATASCLLLISLGCSRTEDAQTSTASRNEASIQANPGTQNTSAPEIKKIDAEITRLEKEVEKSPGDDMARSSLAKAYLNRGNMLAAARQYKEALSDYRSALHLDPDNEEAQQKTAAMRKEIGGDASDDDAGEPVGLPPSPDALDEGGSSGEGNAPAHRNKKGEPKKAG